MPFGIIVINLNLNRLFGDPYDQTPPVIASEQVTERARDRVEAFAYVDVVAKDACRDRFCEILEDGPNPGSVDEYVGDPKCANLGGMDDEIPQIGRMRNALGIILRNQTAQCDASILPQIL